MKLLVLAKGNAFIAKGHSIVICRYQQHFHGMDLTSIRDAALDEYFNQPVVVSLSL